MSDIPEVMARAESLLLWEIRREPLPRNATGKIMKHVLADPGASSLVQE